MSPGDTKGRSRSDRDRPRALRQWALVAARRIVAATVSLFGVITITFVATRMIGNPVELLLGNNATQEGRDALIRELGLDQPLYVQFGHFLGELARLDFGRSTVTMRPVIDDVISRLPATLELVGVAMVLTVLIGVPLGLKAGAHPGSAIDRVVGWITRLGAALPSFWVGLLLILLLTYTWRLFPTPLGIDIGVARRTGFLLIDSMLAGSPPALFHSLALLTLPAVTLALNSLPAVLQIVRNTTSSVVTSEYIRTAKASGIEGKLLNRTYVFRNVLGPLLPVVAMSASNKIGNSALVEVVFLWPGIGQYAVNAMNNLDYAPVLAVVLITAVFYIVGYLIAEILQAIFDPRVRTQQ